MKKKEIDVKKVIGNQRTEFDIARAMNKAHQDVMEALHIMQSTIENFEDAECLQLNKERMNKYFNKFAKD